MKQVIHQCGVTVATLPPAVELPMFGTEGNQHARLADVRKSVRAVVRDAVASSGVTVWVDVGAAMAESLEIPEGPEMIKVQFKSIDGVGRGMTTTGRFRYVSSEMELLELVRARVDVGDTVGVTYIDSGYYASEKTLVGLANLAQYVLVADHTYQTAVGAWMYEDKPQAVWFPPMTGERGVYVMGPASVYPHPDQVAPWSWVNGYLEAGGDFAVVRVKNDTPLGVLVMLTRPVEDIEFTTEARVTRCEWQWDRVVCMRDGLCVAFHAGTTFSYAVAERAGGSWHLRLVGTVGNPHQLIAAATRMASDPEFMGAEVRAGLLATQRSVCFAKVSPTHGIAQARAIMVMAVVHAARTSGEDYARLYRENDVSLAPSWWERVRASLLRTVLDRTRGIVVPHLIYRLKQVAPTEPPLVVDRYAMVSATLVKTKPSPVGVSLASTAGVMAAQISSHALLHAAITRQCAPKVDVPPVARERVRYYVEMALLRFVVERSDYAPLHQVLRGRPSKFVDRVHELRGALTREFHGDPIELAIRVRAVVEFFMKRENGGRRPRMISMVDLVCRTIQAQGVYPIEAELARQRADVANWDVEMHAVWTVKGLLPVAVGPYITTVLQRFHPQWADYLIYDTDFSAFDGSIHEFLLEGQYAMFDVLTPGYAEYFRAIFHELQDWFMKSREGIVIKGRGTRLSGMADTSVGNGLLQRAVVMITHMLVANRRRVRAIDHIAHFVEGDDGLGFMSPTYLALVGMTESEYAHAFVKTMREEFGLTVKFRFKSPNDLVEFCGASVMIRQWVSRGVWSNDPRWGRDGPCGIGELHDLVRCDAGHARGPDGACPCAAKEENKQDYVFDFPGLGLTRCKWLGRHVNLPHADVLFTGGSVFVRLLSDAIVVPKGNTREAEARRVALWELWTHTVFTLPVVDRKGGVLGRLERGSLRTDYDGVPTVVPLADQLWYNQLAAGPVVYSVSNVRRVVAKLLTTSSGLPECHAHASFEVSCKVCRQSYVAAVLMLRARAMCLIGMGCCIRSLLRIAYLVLVTTDSVVTRVPEHARSTMLHVLYRTEERHKLVVSQLKIDDFFSPTSTWMLQASRVYWVESDAEVWRQGVDPKALDKWADDVIRFLRSGGPLPQCPVDEVDEGTMMEIGPIRCDMVEVAPDDEVVYSQEFYNRISVGLRGQ